MESNSFRGRLLELHGSGYEIADGQPNITGWTIKDMNHHRIGVVDDLLFDEQQQKVRYIIANLKDNSFDLEKRKVLIPIGIAQLHESNDDVIIPSVSGWQLRALPSYKEGINDRDEQEVYTIFSMPSNYSTSWEADWRKPANFYEHTSFDNENLYRRRRAESDQPIVRNLHEPDHAASRDLRERDTLAASHSTAPVSDSEDLRRDSFPDQEKLISRIKKMHADLDEIEHDIRKQRDIR